jgi:hypothetical protein
MSLANLVKIALQSDARMLVGNRPIVGKAIVSQGDLSVTAQASVRAE